MLAAVAQKSVFFGWVGQLRNSSCEAVRRPSTNGELRQPLFTPPTFQTLVVPFDNGDGVTESICDISQRPTLPEPEIDRGIAETVGEISLNPQPSVLHQRPQILLPQTRRGLRQACSVPEDVPRIAVRHFQQFLVERRIELLTNRSV